MNEPVSMKSGARTGWLLWYAFALGALLLLDVVDLTVWAVIVSGVAVALALLPVTRVPFGGHPDRTDLLVVGGFYLGVVGAFSLAFRFFTTDNVLGLFLSFAAGLLLGVVGPVVYQVWVRDGSLIDLGIGARNMRSTLAVGLSLAAVQFVITLWGIDLPQPVDWVPLLVMSVTVGLFEAVFFRGFVQNRLESSFGTGPGVAGAAVLYGLYHVGYGMGFDEIGFLVGLGVVYAVVFRLVGNVLVLWPLLTPVGSFFNNLEAGDIGLPWASIAGFADVLVAMAVVIWFARRHIRKREDVETTHTEELESVPA